MAGLKLELFQGLIPRTSDRLLPPMAATFARNTKLVQGELRGFHEETLDTDLSSGSVSPVRRAFRVPNTPTDAFLAFDSQNVDVVRSPLVNDTYDRYYWAGDNDPKMNTAARIINGDDPFLLGVPTPNNKPTVTPPGGSDETRSYVYTFVSAYGEEGPPSPPETVTGGSGTPWELSGMDTTVPDSGERNITKKNIYRTVTGEATTSFFFVAQIDLDEAEPWNDVISNETVASNNLLESTGFIEPPDDLEGFVVMPNGYLVGWVDRRLVFSEPYRPHAWPAEYELSTEFDIVSLAVYGSTLIIGTESQPYWGQGVSPASFTMQKLDGIEPCLSRRGMVATREGVYYPSINGLVLATSSGASIITQNILTREEWADYNPESIFASQVGMQYIGFNSNNFGFIFDPQTPSATFVELDGFNGIDGIETDRYSGNVLLLKDDRVYSWDEETANRVQWRWRSKVYQFPDTINFGAFRLNFETGNIVTKAPVSDPYEVYNDALFAAAKKLNTLNGVSLGGSPAQSSGLGVTTVEAETRQPLGGSLLFPLTEIGFTTFAIRVTITIRTKGVTKVIFDEQIFNEDIVRLPTGFKSDIWQIDLNGNTNLYSMQLAETPKGLKQV